MENNPSSYDRHNLQLINELIKETYRRYKSQQSLWQYDWGQSNTLMVLGVLRHVASEFNILPIFDIHLDQSILTALKQLHFYSSRFDARGVKGFDLSHPTGKLANLKRGIYPDYDLCMDYAQLIIDDLNGFNPKRQKSSKDILAASDVMANLYKDEQSAKKSSLRDKQKKEAFKKRPKEKEDFLERPLQKPHKFRKVVTKAQKDLNAIDVKFQREIIKLAK